MTNVYEIGYEDGTYRRQQLPEMEESLIIELSIEDEETHKIPTIPLNVLCSYYKGWHDGYSNQEPSERITE